MKTTNIRPIVRQHPLSLWPPIIAWRDANEPTETDQTRTHAEAQKAAKASAFTQAYKADQKAQACSQTQTDTKGILRIVTASTLSRVKTPLPGRALKERLTRFMYPIHLIERVVNYLGVVGILSVIAGCIMGSMGKAVPDMIIFAAGTAIGALAGIAQATHAKDSDTRNIGGVHVQHADGEVMELLKQITAQLQDHAKRIREQEAA